MRRTAALRLVTHPALLLFVFFVAAYGLTAAGHLDSTDGRVVAAVARRLLFHDSLALPGDTPNAVIGVNGFGYSKYGIAQSIVEVPFAQIGYWLSVSMRDPQMIEWAMSFTNTVVAALGCVLFYLLARRLGASERRAVALTLVYGLCTLAWTYAKTDFNEPLQTLALLSAAYALLRARLPRFAAGWLLLAGGSLAVALLTKSALLIVMPAFALYVLAHYMQLEWRPRPRLSVPATVGGRQSALRSQALIWAPVALAILVTLWLNTVRFGRPLDFGYGRDPGDTPFSGSLLAGTFGLLLSPDAGLLFYATPVVLGIVGLRRFRRQCPHETLLIAALAVSFVGFYGDFRYWAGLSSYGPRYLVPLVPFLLLPAVDAFPGILAQPRRHVVAIALVVVVALAGFVEQALGVMVSFRLYTALTCTTFPCPATLDISRSELLYHLWLLRPSLAFDLQGVMPALSLGSYPFGPPPAGRAGWQDIFATEMRYFWFVYLPDPLSALRHGATYCGAVMLTCAVGLGVRLRAGKQGRKRGTMRERLAHEPSAAPTHETLL